LSDRLGFRASREINQALPALGVRGRPGGGRKALRRRSLFSCALRLEVARRGRADLPGRGGNEHGLVQEERTPFLGIGPVGISAAEELELPVETFYEAGIAKQGDQVAFVPEEPTDWI